MYTNVRQNYKMYFTNIWLVALVKRRVQAIETVIKITMISIMIMNMNIYMYMYKCEHINWHCKEKELGTKLASSHSQSRG